jgi:RHS repeat-associated protein
MHLFLSLLLALFSFSLFAFQNDPKVKIHEAVDASTGAIDLSLRDIHIDAEVPLSLYRSYHPSTKGQFAPHTHLFINFRIPGPGTIEYLSVRAAEPNGDLFEYLPDRTLVNRFSIDFSKLKGIANTASGVLSGKTHLKNQHLHLNEQGYIILKTPDGTKRLFAQVNKFGLQLLFLLEKEVLPTGHQIVYQYDRSSRLTHVKTASPDGSKVYASAKIQYGKDAFTVTTSDGREFSYGYEAGNLTLTDSLKATFIDGKLRRLGEQVFAYDGHDRVRSLSSPQATFSYGKNSVEVTEGTGDKKAFVFNARGLPIEIDTDPDQGKVGMEWSMQGELLAILSSSGGREFFYDERGNVVEERTAGKESIFRTYDENNLLTSQRTGEGPITTYSYLPGTDLITRRELDVGLSERREYDRDHLLTKQIVEYPGCFRVVKEFKRRTENPGLGKPELIETTTDEGLLTQEIFTYQEDGTVATHRCLDGAGNSLPTPPKSGGGITWQGEAFDHAGNLIPLEENGSQFDALGRYCRLQTGKLFTHVVWNEYGFPAEVSLQTDQGQLLRQKKFETDQQGRLLSTTVPSDEGGGTAHYHYDANGVLNHWIDAYGAVHTSTEKETEECILPPSEGREYNNQGLLLKETFDHGHALSFTYDEEGRRTSLQLPDGSSVVYRWGLDGIKEITRMTKSHKVAYKHLCLVNNIAGVPSRQRLIEGMGELLLRSDQGGEISSAACDMVKFSVASRDSQGRVHSILNNGKEEFLTHEATPTMKSGEYELSSDGTGHINKILTSEALLLFTYDSAGRRMTKEVFELKEGKWVQTKKLAFLYDGMVEIGAMDEILGTLTLLKVIAPDLINTGDDAIAYEIEGRIYLPIHDLFGNVSQLHSILRRGLIESYRFTTWGAEEIYDSWNDIRSQSKVGNPWRFQCAHTDEEVGLVYHKGRYYDPSKQCYLTGDPQPKENFVSCRKVKELEVPSIFFERVHSAENLFPEITYPLVLTRALKR